MNTFGLLVVGSRNYSDYNTLAAICDHLLSNHVNDCITIVSGGARGADSLARKYAIARGYHFVEMPADWSRGKSAGYIRNHDMHMYLTLNFESRGCVAFWDGTSRGTAHNFILSRKFNTPMKTYNFVTNSYMPLDVCLRKVDPNSYPL